MVCDGDIVPTYDPELGLNITDYTTTTASIPTSAMVIHWHIIRRSDVKLGIIEMFLNRGKYGTSVIDNMNRIINNLSAIDLKNKELEYQNISNFDTDLDFLDLDTVLEIFTSELYSVNLQIVHLERIIFGNPVSLNITVPTSKNDNEAFSSSTFLVDKTLSDAIEFSQPLFKSSQKLDSLGAIKVLHDFVYLLIEHDKTRSGLISNKVFSELCKFAARNFINTNNSGSINTFVELSLKGYR
jgi:hypothetical protein